jgi:Tol biopolymer transport system component
LSPDGSAVVFGQIDDGGVDRLWLRSFDSFTPHALAGTEGAKYAFWSPDSRHIGFYLGGRLKRLEVASGRIQPIGGEGGLIPRGASWGTNGEILFAPHSNTGVWVIDANGGTARQVTTPDPDIPDSSHRWPHFLPDGDHFLFLLWTNDQSALEEHGGVYLASISGNQQPVRLVPNASGMAYAKPGYLLVMQEDNLMAIPFDAEKREVRGAATVLAGGVLLSSNSGHAVFSVSSEGTLVYSRGRDSIPPTTFVWYDREGGQTATPIEPTPFLDGLRLSSDATRAVARLPGSTGDGEIWMLDLLRGVRTRISPSAPFDYSQPALSPGGDRVLYGSPKNGKWDFYLRHTDGSGVEESFLRDDEDKNLYDWSRDGNRIIFWHNSSGIATSNLWIYDARTQQSEILIEGDPMYFDARFSPDGNYVAYASDESGRYEVFVQKIEDGARSQVSTGGGARPHWRDDGRELVYFDLDRHMMAVSVDPGANEQKLRLGAPKELFSLDREPVDGDAAGDHTRFLFGFTDQQVSEPLHVILNWDAGLQ